VFIQEVEELTLLAEAYDSDVMLQRWASLHLGKTHLRMRAHTDSSVYSFSGLTELDCTYHLHSVFMPDEIRDDPLYVKYGIQMVYPINQLRNVALKNAMTVSTLIIFDLITHTLIIFDLITHTSIIFDLITHTLIIFEHILHVDFLIVPCPALPFNTHVTLYSVFCLREEHILDVEVDFSIVSCPFFHLTLTSLLIRFSLPISGAHSARRRRFFNRARRSPVLRRYDPPREYVVQCNCSHVTPFCIAPSLSANFSA
jgi:hypothetical protein